MSKANVVQQIIARGALRSEERSAPPLLEQDVMNAQKAVLEQLGRRKAEGVGEVSTMFEVQTLWVHNASSRQEHNEQLEYWVAVRDQVAANILSHHAVEDIFTADIDRWVTPETRVVMGHVVGMMVALNQEGM